MGATVSTCWKLSATMPGSGWPRLAKMRSSATGTPPYFVGLIRDAEAAHTQMETACSG